MHGGHVLYGADRDQRPSPVVVGGLAPLQHVLLASIREEQAMLDPIGIAAQQRLLIGGVHGAAIAGMDQRQEVLVGVGRDVGIDFEDPEGLV